MNENKEIKQSRSLAFRLRSTIRTILWFPTFGLYLIAATILALFLRGGRTFARTFLVWYTLNRLFIGFLLLMIWRVLRTGMECCLSILDCILRTPVENDLLDKYENTLSYEEWLATGQELDNLNESINSWKNTRMSNDYDWELLIKQLDNMQIARRDRDVHKMMQTISNIFRRSFCSLHNRHLYAHSYTGTKWIIESYYREVIECIAMITENLETVQWNQTTTTSKSVMNNIHKSITNNEEGLIPFIREDNSPRHSLGTGNDHGDYLNSKGDLLIRQSSIVSINDGIDFFYRCKKSLGRTALCLSGGGALAMAHAGVIRALIKEKCLPKVLSGTSGGAIVVGYLATISDEELEDLDEIFGYKMANKFGVRFLPTFLEQLTGAYRNRLLMDANDFVVAIKKYVGNMTFKDAWIKTKRHASICVSYSTKNNPDKSHAHALVLNHITAPDILIWSAVTASCALPGLMAPQQLWMRSSKGKIEPYYPDGVQWVDGSIQADIPLQQLQEMFRANYFIVSQVNPHVTPFLLTRDESGTPFGKVKGNLGIQILEMLDDLANQTVNHQLERLVRLKAIPAVYGHNFDKFARQNFSGDITIVPKFPLNLRFKLLSHPTEEDMVQYIAIGEKAAWKHLAQIKDMLRIEKAIDDAIIKLKTKRRNLLGKTGSDNGTQHDRSGEKSPSNLSTILDDHSGIDLMADNNWSSNNRRRDPSLDRKKKKKGPETNPENVPGIAESEISK